MAKRLLHYDRMTGISTFHDYDHSSQKTIITEEQDVNGILNYCKDLRNNKGHKSKMLKGDNNYHYATVPVTVIQEWLLKYGVDAHNPKHTSKCDALLSGDYKHLLTVNKI